MKQYKLKVKRNGKVKNLTVRAENFMDATEDLPDDVEDIDVVSVKELGSGGDSETDDADGDGGGEDNDSDGGTNDSDDEVEIISVEEVESGDNDDAGENDDSDGESDKDDSDDESDKDDVKPEESHWFFRNRGKKAND